MAEFTFTGRGRLQRIDRFTSKGGKEILTLIFLTEGQYPQVIPVKVFGALGTRADQWAPGCELDVTGRLGGRGWQGKYYPDIVANTVEVVGEKQDEPAKPPHDYDSDVPF